MSIDGDLNTSVLAKRDHDDEDIEMETSLPDNVSGYPALFTVRVCEYID